MESLEGGGRRTRTPGRHWTRDVGEGTWRSLGCQGTTTLGHSRSDNAAAGCRRGMLKYRD